MKKFHSLAKPARTLVVILSFILCQPAIPGALEFEMIYDLDLSYFLVNPKLPWAGDPFEKYPGFAPVIEGGEKFALTGIIYNSDSPVAIINTQTVRIGDAVGSRVVCDIGENYVILKRGGSEIELNLPTPDQNWDYGEDEESQ